MGYLLVREEATVSGLVSTNNKLKGKSSVSAVLGTVRMFGMKCHSFKDLYAVGNEITLAKIAKFDTSKQDAGSIVG